MSNAWVSVPECCLRSVQDMDTGCYWCSPVLSRFPESHHDAKSNASAFHHNISRTSSLTSILTCTQWTFIVKQNGDLSPHIIHCHLSSVWSWSLQHNMEHSCLLCIRGWTCNLADAGHWDVVQDDTYKESRWHMQMSWFCNALHTVWWSLPGVSWEIRIFKCDWMATHTSTIEPLLHLYTPHVQVSQVSFRSFL